MKAEATARSSTNKKSTVVRFLDELNGKGLYWAFQALDLAAPSVGAAWAEKLFLTPPKHRPPEAEKKVLEKGRFFKVRLESGKGIGFDRPAREIAVWTWNHGENRPNVYLMHGWGGRGGQLHPFVEPLVAAGFSVIALDAPAHGQSPGEMSSAVEFSRALLAVVRAAGPADAIIAHSLGAAVTTFSMRKGLLPRRVVLIGAPSGGEDFTTTLVDKIGVPPKTLKKMRDRIENRTGVQWHEFDTTVPPAQNAEAFVIHDRDDQEVSWKSGKAIADGWPGSRLLLTSGLGHRRILRSPMVIEEVVEFLKKS